MKSLKKLKLHLQCLKMITSAAFLLQHESDIAAWHTCSLMRWVIRGNSEPSVWPSLYYDRSGTVTRVAKCAARVAKSVARAARHTSRLPAYNTCRWLMMNKTWRPEGIIIVSLSDVSVNKYKCNEGSWHIENNRCSYWSHKLSTISGNMIGILRQLSN